MNERTGSIFKRKDGSLWARVTYRDSSGKRHDLQRRATTRTEAKAIIKTLLAGIAQGGERAIDGERMMFRELTALYREMKVRPAEYYGEGEHRRKVAGMRSWRSADYYLRTLEGYFSRKRVKDITHADIEKFKLARLRLKTRYDSQRTIASVNRELAMLRSVLRFAWRQGWIARSPFDMGASVIEAASEVKRDRMLGHDEERRLLAACSGKRAHLRSIVIVALDTGMRRGEIIKLTWGDVDFISKVIRVRATTTKTETLRHVAMTPRVEAELRALWEVSPKDSGILVFGIRDTFKKSFQTACREAGIEDLRFHDLRHVAITRMIEAGLPPASVMKISGHTQMTTFARYVNPGQEMIRRGAEMLAAFNAVREQEATRSAETEFMN